MSCDVVGFVKRNGVILLAFLCIIGCNAIFGLASVIYKFGMRDLNSFVLAFYRQVGATICFSFISLFTDRNLPHCKDSIYFVIMGTLGVFLSQTLFILGIDHAGTVLASILQLLTIPLTTGFAILGRLEKLSWLKAFGILGSLTGAAVMLSGKGFSDSSMKEQSIGIILLVIETMCISVWIVIAKKYVYTKYPTSTVNTSMHITGLPWIVILCIAMFAKRPEVFHVGQNSILVLVFAILAHSVLGYFMLNFANANLEASLCSAFSVLTPLFGTLFGIVLLSETMDVFGIVGSIIILLGLGCIVYQKAVDRRKEVKEQLNEKGQETADAADLSAVDDEGGAECSISIDTSKEKHSRETNKSTSLDSHRMQKCRTEFCVEMTTYNTYVPAK